MIRIAHIVDDATLGGVTRTLAAVESRLGPDFRHERITVRRGELPRLPPVQAVCVHLSASWARLPLLAGLAARHRGRIAIIEHSYAAGFERLEVAHPRRFRAMLRLAYRLADRVVAVSEAQAAWMRDARLAPTRPIHVIRPASDCEHLMALAPPGPRHGALRLGAMGRLSPEKGFEVLLEAMRRLPPGLATLSLAGTGPGEAALAAAAAGVTGVHLVGAVAHHAGWLAGLDAVVVPSRRETYGLVALEARTAARPVLATAVDGLPEQLAGGAGMLVPPDDPAALCASIARLATLDVTALGEAARSSAAGHLARSVAGWRMLLTELAEDGPRHRTRQSGGLSPAGRPTSLA